MNVKFSFGKIPKKLTSRHAYLVLFVFLPDIFSISLASFTAYSIRFPNDYVAGAPAISKIEYSQILTVLNILWIFTLFISNLYEVRKSIFISSNYRRIFKQSINFFIVIGFMSFVFKLSFSRIIFITYLSTGLFFIFFVRTLVYVLILKPLILKKRISIRLMIIGRNRGDISEYSEWLIKNRNLGYSVVSRMECHKIDHHWIEEFERIVRIQKIEDVLLIPGMESVKHFSRFINFCEDLNIQVNWVPLDSGNLGYWRTPLQQEGTPFLTFLKPEISIFWRIIKRVFDIIFSSLVLLLLMPILLVISILIYITSGSPVIFTQTRIGYHGTPFKIFKFRTMVVGAEMMKNNSDNMHRDDHVIFKSKSDPRVTKFGRFLRKYSLDELLQFFNVFYGNMSVVGPRPYPIEESAKFNSLYERRLNAKPGITGPWQISGRSDLDLKTSVALDLNYLTHWSFTRDLWIIFATVGAIFKGKGAY